MRTTDTAFPTAAGCVCRPSLFNRLGQHRWLLGGVGLAVFGAGFAWQWSWLVAIGVAPLLISAAPCLAMCALGLCMHRMGRNTRSAMTDASPAPLTSETPSLQQEN
jgi:hypothetical protein